MSESQPSTFMRSKEQPDADGCPALLIQPDVVLVPRPAAHEPNLETALEVVVVDPQSKVPVERIRVASGSLVPGGAQGIGLLLGLERPSMNRPFDVGSPEEFSLLVEVSLSVDEADLWGLLLNLKRVQDLPTSVPDDVLANLRTLESTERPPVWPQGEGGDQIVSWIGAILGVLGKK
ncbi:hypothetical protein WCD74_24550 [Actinomycetospora sp. OC33-EN08]|uniref:Uncharacterized protein n=1 Tax=Actinomycetospora aurantiaca TaxID=3129233 RepID=A0ABU8MUL4_9PSEU